MRSQSLLDFRRYFGFVAASILFVSVTIQFSLWRTKFPPDAVLTLSSLLPPTDRGWQAREVPLTETESQNIQNILKYDEAIFRVYTSGDITIGVLILQWRPSATTGFHAHTPDICFPSSGWQSRAAEHQVELDIGSWRSQPAERRVFTKQNQQTEVWFWHLQDGVISGYMVGAKTDWRARLPYLFRRWQHKWNNEANNSGEVLIRVTSNHPLTTPNAREFLSMLAPTIAPSGIFYRINKD